MGAVLAFARMISEHPVAGLFVLWHHLLHYLLSSQTCIDEPETEDDEQGKGITRMISEYPVAGLSVLWHHLLHYLLSSKTHIDDLETKDDEQQKGITRTAERYIYTGGYRTATLQGTGMSNSEAFDALRWREPILKNVLEALEDPNTNIIGVYGSDDGNKDTLLQKVRRIVDRDKMFDVVLTGTITKKPDVKRIQEEIAGQLGFTFTFNQKSKGKRASELLDRIKNEQKILVILCGLLKRLDLGKVGIPFGADHTSCKILLTSTSEQVLSNQMNAQKIFMV